MRPISKDPCMAFEILEKGKKVKRNGKKRPPLVIFSFVFIDKVDARRDGLLPEKF